MAAIEDATRQVLDCWAELPPNMQDTIDEFRVRLGAAVDSVEFVKRALDQEVNRERRTLGLNNRGIGILSPVLAAGDDNPG